MAKVAPSSLTEHKCNQHLQNAAYRSELACTKIIGFHLQKLKAGGCWRFRYSNFEGKKRILNLGKYINSSNSRIAAANLAEKYRAQLRDGKDPSRLIAESKKTEVENAKRKVQGKLGSYLQGVYKRHQSRKTNSGIHTIKIIENHFSDFLCIPMEEIDDIKLKEWQLNKEKENKSHATIKRAFGALRTLLRHAVREGYLEEDPSRKFKLMPPVVDSENVKKDIFKQRRMLTSEELERLHKALDVYNRQLIEQRNNSRNHGKPYLTDLAQLAFPHWFFPFFHLAAFSGLRTGDLYSLTWQELNLDFRRLIKTPNKTRHHIDATQVDLPLNDDILLIMKAWHEQNGSPNTGLVFPSSTSKKLDKQAHVRHWKKVRTIAKIDENLDFYSLRHNFISSMVAGGVPMFTVARLAGHKSVKMIEQHYGHLCPSSALTALNLVAVARPSGLAKHG